MEGTTAPKASERDAILADLEDLWRILDEQFASLGPSGWTRKFGPDWTVADVPHHLSYFDRDTVAPPVERGAEVPDDVVRSIHRTARELNAWNARKFAERPPDQTVERSLEQMREAREAVRRAAARLTDGDLDRPAFVPVLGIGWRTIRVALDSCVAHTWSHVIEMRLRIGVGGRVPTGSATHRALGFFARVVCWFVDPGEAAKGPFTLTLDFTGAGGGAWTIFVRDGACSVAEGRAGRADVVLTQSPETFVKTYTQMKSPLVLMLTREMKVKGFGRMARFAKLFPPPSAVDRVVAAPLTPSRP